MSHSTEQQVYAQPGWDCQSMSAHCKGAFGFFHPFANGGGGGERVLWYAACVFQVASKQVTKAMVPACVGVQ